MKISFYVGHRVIYSLVHANFNFNCMQQVMTRLEIPLQNMHTFTDKQAQQLLICPLAFLFHKRQRWGNRKKKNTQEKKTDGGQR